MTIICATNFQAWFETGVSGSFGDTTWGSMTPTSSSFSYMGASSIDVNVHENKVESTYLYIQMEYCPRYFFLLVFFFMSFFPFSNIYQHICIYKWNTVLAISF